MLACFKLYTKRLRSPKDTEYEYTQVQLEHPPLCSSVVSFFIPELMLMSKSSLFLRQIKPQLVLNPLFHKQTGCAPISCFHGNTIANSFPI